MTTQHHSNMNAAVLTNIVVIRGAVFFPAANRLTGTAGPLPSFLWPREWTMPWRESQRSLLVGLIVCFIAIPLNGRPVPMRAAEGTKSTVEGSLAGRSSLVARRLQERLTAGWTGVSLRQVLDSLQDTLDLHILLDRRVDPTVTVTYSCNETPLETALLELAAAPLASSTGEAPVVRAVGGTIYIGPAQRLRSLLTVVQRRQADLLRLQLPTHDPGKGLLSRHDFAWPERAEVSAILSDVAHAAGVEIANPKALPHDRWTAGTLANCTALEAATVLLYQFDLTFEVAEHGRAISLVPLPDRELVERAMRVSNPRKLRDELPRWKQQFPNVGIVLSGRGLMATGPAEDLDALYEQVRAGDPDDTADSPTASPVNPAAPAAPNIKPVPQQRFTMTIKNVTRLAVLNELVRRGTKIEFDEAALRRAGVDLDGLIVLQMNAATPEELMTDLLGNQPCEWKIELQRIVVTPVESPQ